MPGKPEPRLEGQAREAMAKKLRLEYEKGTRMVSLMKISNSSYAVVSKLLDQAGTVRRGLGSAPPEAAPQHQALSEQEGQHDGG